MKKKTLLPFILLLMLTVPIGGCRSATEPVATPKPAMTPTSIPETTATLIPTGTSIPESTTTPAPEATATPTPEPTATPIPTSTPTPEPTATPIPTSAPTPEPTATPIPTSTPTPEPTATPVPTATPIPTSTPTPEPTATPVPTSTPTPEPTATPVPTATPSPEPTITPTYESINTEIEDNYFDIPLPGSFDKELAKEAFILTNEKRKEHGLPELIWDGCLYESARVRAAESSLYFSHTRLDGTDWYTIYDKLHGENLACNYDSAKSVVNGWMISEDHKTNILNSNFKRGSIAVFKTITGWYYCQHFGY